MKTYAMMSIMVLLAATVLVGHSFAEPPKVGTTLKPANVGSATNKDMIKARAAYVGNIAPANVVAKQATQASNAQNSKQASNAQQATQAKQAQQGQSAQKLSPTAPKLPSTAKYTVPKLPSTAKYKLPKLP